MDAIFLHSLKKFFFATSHSMWDLSSMKVKVKSLSPVRLFVTPWTVAYRLLCPWDFPGKNTGVGCLFLIQILVP